MNVVTGSTKYQDIDLQFDVITKKYRLPDVYKKLFRYNIIEDDIVINNIPENGGYFSNNYKLGGFSLDNTAGVIRKYLGGDNDGTSFNFEFGQDINTMFYEQKFTPLTFSLSENQEEFLKNYHTENAFSGKTKYTRLIK